MSRRLTKDEREAQRLLAEWQDAERLMLETQRDYGYSTLIDRLETRSDAMLETFHDWCSDHELCDVCGYKKRISGWIVDKNCPEHTEPWWIETDVTEHGFDLDAWCAEHDYTRDGYRVTPNTGGVS